MGTRLFVPLLTLLLPAVALAQQGPVAVRVEPVERRPMQASKPLVATIEPVTETKLASELDGLVVERKFDEGNVVGKDEVIVRLDTDLLKIEREAAQAAADSLAAMLDQAKIKAENSQREANRLGVLFERKVIPEKEYLDALTISRTDAAAVKARAADVAEKKAEVARLDLQIKKSEIKAPMGKGVVARRYVEVGQWVKQGDPVADLLWLDPLFVRANVPEQVISKIKKGDDVRIRIEALGSAELTGKVDQIIPAADPGSRTFAVKVLLPNPEGAIRPGFFAMATFLAGGGEQFLVPRDAVINRGTQSHVVAAREGKAVVIPVKPGPGDGNKVFVSGELKEGDRVITRGNETLRGGEPLQIQGDPPAAAAAAK